MKCFRLRMGRIFLEHIGGARMFSCAGCDTILTNRNELISTRFTGATGRAFLFNKVVNLTYRYFNKCLIIYCFCVHKILCCNDRLNKF